MNVVTEFLESTGFQAQLRRRTEVGVALRMGAMLANLKKHIQAAIKGIVICRQTIHHLFVAPRKGTINAANYKGVVQARVAGKKKTLRKFKGHPDAHHAASLVRFVMEFGALFVDFVDVISIDDKAKIKVGTAAVSRYHQMCMFFLEIDMPNLLDHDFPDPGSLITPSGYLHLKFISGGEEIDSNTGRKRIKLNRSGALKVVNRAFKFHSSSAHSHATDLYEFMLERNLCKPGTVVISDGG